MRTIFAGLALSILAVTSAKATVTLIINNQSGQPDSNVWVQFAGQTGSSPTAALNGTSVIGGVPTTIQPTNYTTPSPSPGVPGTAVNDFLPGYQLSTLSGTNGAGSHMYEVNNFYMAGGRIYFSLGASGFTSVTRTGSTIVGYTPAVNNFNDPNFLLRTDKVEAFITGSSDDNIDMTAVDAFAIPFQVTAYVNGAVVNTLTSANGSTIDTALKAISANASAPVPGTFPATVNGTITTVQPPYVTSDSPYLNINSNSLGMTTPAPYTYSPVNSTGSFVRVIGNDQDMTGNVWFQNSPAVDPIPLNNNNMIPANYLWQPFNKYLSYLDGTSASATPPVTPYSGTTTIAGAFAGVGAPTNDNTMDGQTYNLVATFNPTGTMNFTPAGMSSPVTYTGYMTLTGTTIMTAGPSTGLNQTITIQIPYAFMLNPTGIIGANAPYTVTYGSTPATEVQAPANNVFTWIEGDFFAGMNVGSVGSTKTFTGTVNGHPYVNAQVGSMPSQDWFGMGQVLETATPSANKKVWDYYFSYLQSSPNYYNTYGAAIYPYTDAYNFAYSDRVMGGNVAISWNATVSSPTPVDTIVITILPDGVSSLDATPFNGSSLGGGWFYQPSFGYYNNNFYPWVYSNTLGFTYFDLPTPGSSDTYMYASDAQLGWLYTNPSILPNVYSFQEATWLYFYPLSTYHNFYNYTSGQFETHVQP